MEPREKAALLPDSPGVYLFKDAAGTVLYVGKATSLRSRVRSYFLESRWMDAKTGSLAREIADLDTIVLANAREALALENNLIKQYHPKFNVLLRDDKTYPYIKLTRLRKNIPASTSRAKSKKTARSTSARTFRPAWRAASCTFVHKRFMVPSLQRRSHAQSSAPLFAVLHQALPRPMRRRSYHRRATTRKPCATRASFSKASATT